MRQVAQIMGMPISLDIVGEINEQIFKGVFDRLRQVDSQFSPYKKSSELNRFRSDEINIDNFSTQMKQIITACKRAEKTTGGYFSAWYGGYFDPSGYVKGWAIKEAAKLLRDYTFCLAAGGDILAQGQKSWHIGIQNPTDPKSIIAKINLKNAAVATSGNYERGAHIINPKTMQPAKDWLSLSVIGQDIIQADVLATAGFAMGKPAMKFIEEKGYNSLAIDPAGTIFLTPGIKKILI